MKPDGLAHRNLPPLHHPAVLLQSTLTYRLFHHRLAKG